MMRLKILAALCLVGTLADAASLSTLSGVFRTAGKPQADAAVWLDAPQAGARNRSRVVLDQRNSNFYPRVLVVQAGTKVDFPNNDRTYHNVFSFHDGKRFDLGLYPIGAEKQIVFDK